MATTSSTQKHKSLTAPLDNWSIKEKLALASSVYRSGDQNWASVIRAIRPFCEETHPAEWFTQKQCALQYAALLDNIETPKRKRGERGDVDTPGMRIMRRLSIERIDELKHIISTQQKEYKKLKHEIEAIQAGQLDDQVPQLLAEIEAEEECKLDVPIPSSLVSTPADGLIPSTVADGHELGQDTRSVPSMQIDVNEEVVNVEVPDNNTLVVTALPLDAKDKSPLKLYIPSPGTSPKGLSTQEHVAKIIKEESAKLYQEQITRGLRTPDKSPLRSSKSSPVVSADQKQSPLAVAVTTAPTREASQTPTPTKAETPLPTPSSVVPEAVSTSPSKDSTTIKSSPVKPPVPSLTQLLESSEFDEPTDIKQEPDRTSLCGLGSEDVADDSQDDAVTTNLIQAADILAKQVAESGETDDVTSASLIEVDDDIVIKEEPSSPGSSVSSRVSEIGAGSSHGHISKARRGRHRGSLKLHPKEESRVSDVEDTTDDESTKTADSKSLLNLPAADSIPNSPLSQCSDTEDERLYKAWKRSIMLVWRAAATHKYANVFLNKVTNDIAPGYEQIIHRPMDLREIKKNVESGVIRTTSEFQRDAMLMFTNAIMYNDRDHNVYNMAINMYDDVLKHIEQYVSTQILLQNTDPKPLRASRRSETSDKEDEARRRRMSMDQTDAASMIVTKKRKSRIDE